MDFAACIEPSTAPDLQAALAELWSRYRQLNLERVESLAKAARALRLGSLDDEQRLAAKRDAHKLAGSAGTFGYMHGTALAREAEHLLANEEIIADEWSALDAIVSDLQAALEREAMPTTFESHRREAGASVLIVDDDVVLGECLVAEATRQHMRARHVASVEAARAAVVAEEPDVLVLDLTFDDDAQASLAFLAEISATCKVVQVLVLTARTALADRVAAAERGAVAFVQKPADAAHVLDAVAQILNRERAVEARVLVVDDDPLVRNTLEAMLFGRGYRVTTLGDPRRFWDVLEESPPDLVLLDVDMPHLTGIDLCRALRTDLRWAGVPVLFLTGHNDPETVERVFAAGADDYVAKPVIGAELMTRVANRLERTQLHRRLAETDVLTGLANRQKADQSLGQLLRLSERHGKMTAVGVIDLDFFKGVNDRYGHSVGDAVLRRTAEILGRSFRRDDVVGRWGGEEFIVGMYGMPAASGQERLRIALETLRAHEFEGAARRAVPRFVQRRRG